MSLALLYYAVDARKWFKGPRVNVEHIIYAEAVEENGSGSDNAKKVIEKSWNNGRLKVEHVLNWAGNS